MKGLLRFLIICFVLQGSANLAEAARRAEIDAEEAQVFSGPRADSESIIKLKKGMKVVTSNLPTAGFYKIRFKLPSGELQVGWIASDSLKVDPVATPEVNFKEPSLLVNSNLPVRSEQTSQKPKRLRWMVSGGVTTVSLSEMEELTKFTGLSYATYFASEFHFIFKEIYSIALRAESLYGGATAKDPSLQVYTWNVQSFPVVGGGGVMIPINEYFESHLMGGLGLAFNTRLRSVADNKATPNVTQFSAVGFAAVFKGDLVWNVGRSFGIFFEGGYRYITTNRLTPTEEPGVLDRGAEIFQKKGQFEPTPINLSGLFGGLGLSLSF